MRSEGHARNGERLRPAHSAEQFFLKSEGRQIFAAFYPAAARRAPSRNVVLCPPLGAEYLRSQRAFVQLARILAQQGTNVLRIDYSGLGDSEGSEAAGVSAWVADIGAAVREIERGTGVRRHALVGLRLGANLAHLASTQFSSIDSLALWAPAWSGQAHLSALRARYTEWLSGSFCRPPRAPERAPFGFPLDQATERDIARLQIVALPSAVERLLIIEASKTEGSKALLDAVSARVRVTHQVADSSSLWAETSDPLQKELVPAATLAAIAAWLGDE